jgi:hypothetical protein
MEIIRARHEGEQRIYVHNDLLNAAQYYRELIERRQDADDLRGIAFDRMSCMILLAFSVEAAFNFFGHKCVSGWQERQPFNEKVKGVLAALKLDPDRDERPYQTIDTLKAFRDMLAHGKPIEQSFDIIVEAPKDHLERSIILDHEWLATCTQEEVIAAHQDVDEIWAELLAASGLQDFDTITHGHSSLTYVETVEVPLIGHNLNLA